MFLRGTPFDPPRAGISPRTRIVKSAERERTGGKKGKYGSRRGNTLNFPPVPLLPLVPFSLYFFAQVVQSFLHVRFDLAQSLGDALRDEPVAVKRAWRVTAVIQLRQRRLVNLIGEWGGEPHIEISLASFLTGADQRDRSAEVTGVTHEAAGVADGAGRVSQNFEVILRGEIGQRAQPI